MDRFKRPQHINKNSLVNPLADQGQVSERLRENKILYALFNAYLQSTSRSNTGEEINFEDPSLYLTAPEIKKATDSRGTRSDTLYASIGDLVNQSLVIATGKIGIHNGPNRRCFRLNLEKLQYIKNILGVGEVKEEI